MKIVKLHLILLTSLFVSSCATESTLEKVEEPVEYCTISFKLDQAYCRKNGQKSSRKLKELMNWVAISADDFGRVMSCYPGAIKEGAREAR